MAIAEQVVIDLIARTDNLERGFQRARQETTSLNRGIGVLKGALAGVSAVALAREFIRLADASKSLDAQLRLATSGLGTFSQAQKDVARIAAESRAGLRETAGLYGGFVRAAQDLGKSQADAALATETFSKALKIGGASSEDAANATRQFLQALAGGILRAEEFNSVVEASPRVAKLFADGLDVSVGGLRKLVNEGKVSAEQLFAVLNNRKLTAGIDAEFRQLPVTFGEAMQQVENAAITTFGAFDSGGQFSTALANFITNGSKGFADLAAAAEEAGRNMRADIDGTGAVIRDTFEGLRNAFEPFNLAALNSFAGIRADAQGTGNYIRDVLKLIDDFRNAPGDLVRGLEGRLGVEQGSFVNRNITGGPGRRFNSAGRFDAASRLSSATSRRNAAIRRLEGQGFEVPRDANGNVTIGADGKIVGLRKRESAAPPRRAASGGGSGGSARKGRAKAGTSTKAISVADLTRNINRDLVEYTSNIGQIETDRDRNREATRRFEVLFGREGQDFDNPFAGVENNDRAIEQAAKAREEINDMLFRRQEQDIQTLASLWETAFTRGSKGIFEQFKAEGIRAVALILAQLAVGKSLKAALGGVGGPNSGSIFGAIGNVLAGVTKRAGGGNVIAGQPYSINDDLSNRGELFVPAQSGKIYPTGSLQARTSGGGNTTIVQQSFTLDARGGITTPELLRYVNSTAKTEAARAGRVAYQQSPTRVQAYNTLGT